MLLRIIERSMPVGDGYLGLIRSFQRQLLEPEEIPPRAFDWGLLVTVKLAFEYAKEFRPGRRRQGLALRNREEAVVEVQQVVTGEGNPADAPSRGPVGYEDVEEEDSDFEDEERRWK